MHILFVYATSRRQRREPLVGCDTRMRAGRRAENVPNAYQRACDSCTAVTLQLKSSNEKDHMALKFLVFNSTQAIFNVCVSLLQNQAFHKKPFGSIVEAFGAVADCFAWSVAVWVVVVGGWWLPVYHSPGQEDLSNKNSLFWIQPC